jgi:hypothetical protein
LKKEINDFKIDLYTREDVFNALLAVQKNPEKLKDLEEVPTPCSGEEKLPRL